MNFILLKKFILKNNLLLTLIIAFMIISNNLIIDNYKNNVLTNILFFIIPFAIFIYSLKLKVIINKFPIMQYLTIAILITIFTYEKLYNPSAGTDFFKLLLASINSLSCILVIHDLKNMSHVTKDFGYSYSYNIEELTKIYKSILYTFVENENYLSYYNKNINTLFTKNAEFELFINYCKEHEIDFLNMTKEDFSVYKMMTI